MTISHAHWKEKLVMITRIDSQGYERGVPTTELNPGDIISFETTRRTHFTKVVVTSISWPFAFVEWWGGKRTVRMTEGQKVVRFYNAATGVGRKLSYEQLYGMNDND